MKFSLAKDRVGIYFNDGTGTISVQCAKNVIAHPNFVEAIRAARKEFFRVYDPTLDNKPKKGINTGMVRSYERRGCAG